VFNPANPETFWLNVTNIALGVVTLVCFLAIAGSVIQAVAVRLRERARVLVAADDHSFLVPELGLIMADGGEKQNGKVVHRTPEGVCEEPHIIRSEN